MQRRSHAARRAAARSFVEVLETRRLLAGQVFSGEGPVVGSDPRQTVAVDFNLDGFVDLATANYADNSVTINYGTGNGGFANALTLNVGAQPTGIVSADFDGDFLPDLAVATSGNSSISVLRNVDGTFSGPTLIGGANGPQALAVVDVNGDNKPDLVSANVAGASNSVSVLRNTSTATGGIAFTLNDFISGLGAVTQLAVGDVNADGKPDVAAIAGGTTIDFLRNTGTGLSVSTTTITTSAAATSISFGDFNNDGKTDLAASVKSGNGIALTLYRNTTAAGSATPAFATGQVISSLVSSGTLTATDFDGNGKTDIVAVLGTGSNYALEFFNDTAANATAFTFGSGPGGYAGEQVTSFTTADVTGDGRPEILVNNNLYSGQDYVAILRNISTTGSGQLQTPPLASSTVNSPYATVAADFDGDGKPDLAIAGRNGSASGTIGVYRNDLSTVGNPKFVSTPVSIDDGLYVNAMAAADVDGDGKTDLVWVNYYSGQINVARNTSSSGAISFATPVTFAGVTNGSSLVTGDFDGDGKTDLAVTVNANRIAVRLNTSSGAGNVNFGAASYFTAAGNPAELVAGDFDGDGKTDIAAALTGDSTNVAVFRNTSTVGAAAFAVTTVQTAAASDKIVAADFDADGRLDLAVTTPGSGSNVLVDVLQNTGKPGTIAFFTAAVIGKTTKLTNDLIVTDVDGDGRPDLAVSSTNDSSVTLLRNVSTASLPFRFGVSQTFAVTLPGGLAAADFDASGLPDLVVVNNQASGTYLALANRLVANPYATLLNGVLTLGGNTYLRLHNYNGILSVDTPAGEADFAANVVNKVVFAATGNQIVNDDLGSPTHAVDVQVNAGVPVYVTASQHWGNLTLNGSLTMSTEGTAALRVTGLSVASTATLDLMFNDLIYDYATSTLAPTPAQTVAALLTRGYANGAWTGTGLTSTTARDDAAHRTTLGFLEASAYRSVNGTAATLDGFALDDTAVIVRYTLYGDSDLNKKVDFNDFLRLQNGFGGTSNPTFFQGNFNYDGKTDFNDFLLLQNNFNMSIYGARPAAPAARARKR